MLGPRKLYEIRASNTYLGNSTSFVGSQFLDVTHDGPVAPAPESAAPDRPHARPLPAVLPPVGRVPGPRDTTRKIE